MRAILIDSKNREVKEVQLEKGEKGEDGDGYLKALQTAVGGLIEPVGWFEAVVAKHKKSKPYPFETLYVNEEGWNAGPGGFGLFIGAAKSPQPYMGDGIIVAVDRKGNTAPSQLTVEEVREWVRFAPPEVVEQMEKHRGR